MSVVKINCLLSIAGYVTPVWKWKYMKIADSFDPCVPNIIPDSIWILKYICLQKGRQMSQRNAVELSPAVLQMVNHHKVPVQHWYTSIIAIYCFSIFFLLLLSETTDSFKRKFFTEIDTEVETEIETDIYKIRLHRVQDVCSQYGLNSERSRISYNEDVIDYREVHTKYTSKVPDKVNLAARINFCWELLFYSHPFFSTP